MFPMLYMILPLNNKEEKEKVFEQISIQFDKNKDRTMFKLLLTDNIRGVKPVINGCKHNLFLFASTKEFYDFLNSNTFSSLVKSGFSSEQLIDIYDTARVKSTEQSDEAIIGVFEDALTHYRENGGASLKDLQSRINAITLK